MRTRVSYFHFCIYTKEFLYGILVLQTTFITIMTLKLSNKNTYHIQNEVRTSDPFNIFIWLFHKIVSPRLWSYKRKNNIYGHEAAQFINIASLCSVSHKSAGRWNRFKVVVRACSPFVPTSTVSLLLCHGMSRVGRQTVCM